MNERNGWIKLLRATVSDPLLNKDPEHLALWVHLLCSAAYEPTPALLGGKSIILQPGQLTTGRKQLAVNSGISESKVERTLKAFENAQLIEQQKTNKNRLISILSWYESQPSEQQNERPVNNKRTTTEQRADTLEEEKNIRNKTIGADRPPRAKRFTPPTLAEDQSYVAERHSAVDPQGFIDFYEAKGWLVGKTPMKDWKAACRNAEKWERWEHDAKQSNPEQPAPQFDPVTETWRR